MLYDQRNGCQTTEVQTYCPLSSHPGIERVQEMVILGVTISDRIGFGAHMDKICCKPRKSMFALRVLVAHGYHDERLFAIVRATILARLRYASSVWWGFATVGEHNALTVL